MNRRPLQANETRYIVDDRGTSESQPLDFYSPYGCSKGAADQYVHDYSRIFGLPTVVFRMSCIAGPHQFGNEDQGWIAHFLYSAMQGIPLTICGDGRQVRDVLCVEDLVRAFEAARVHTASAAGQVFNMGGGQENALSLLEAIEEIERIIGRRPIFDFEPARPGDQLLYITNYDKFHKMTGWKPRMDVRQTLASIYGWWKQQRHTQVPSVTLDGIRLSDLAEAPGVAS